MITVRCDRWSVSPIISALDVAMIGGLSRLDVGQRTVMVEVLVGGDVGGQYKVTEQTAAGILKRLTRGWNNPPAIYWRGLHGLPILEESVKLIEKYAQVE